MHFVFWTFFIWSTVTDQRLEIRKCDLPTNLPTYQLTNQLTNQLTWVGARDTCVSKKMISSLNLSRFEIWELQLNVTVSPVGTFEFASAASPSTVHLINLIAPLIASKSDISPTISRPNKCKSWGKKQQMRLQCCQNNTRDIKLISAAKYFMWKINIAKG